MRIAAVTYRIASGHRRTILTRWLLLSAQLERRAIFILFFLFVRIPDFFEAVLTDDMFNQAGGIFCSKRKRAIITRAEQSYGRVPLAGLCRLFISVYVPGAGLPGARASAFPAPHGSEICPDRAAYSAPAIDTHKAQCRWPWPFPPANTQWHWIPLP